MNPRLAALKVLLGLESGPQRLDKLLHQELGRWPEAPARDRAQAAGLVYAVLRNRLYLDHLLAAFVNRPLDKLDPPVLAALRLGAADLVILKTPAHAAVGQAVQAAKESPARRGQGLVNGVLRSLGRGWPSVAPPQEAKDLAAHLSVIYSHPAWLVEELLREQGPERTKAWLKANQQEPPVCLRVNTLKTKAPELADLLAGSVDAVSAHPLCPDCLLLEGHRGPLAGLPGFREGLWQAQDAGAAALSTLLGVEPGQRVLDLCAGAGGKTGHLAALMRNQGELVAVEPSKGRFRALKENLGRLGVNNARPMQADGLQLPPELGLFDRVLLDAPCTGLGTVGRRPDLRWRKGPQDVPRLASLQAGLLRAGLAQTKPGGALLYCTCTVTKAENQAVVENLLAHTPGLALKWEPGARLEPDGYFRTLPQRDRSDSFFAARLVKQP